MLGVVILVKLVYGHVVESDPRLIIHEVCPLQIQKHVSDLLHLLAKC